MRNTSKIKTHHKYLLLASIAMTFFLWGVILFTRKFKVFANTDYIIQNQKIQNNKQQTINDNIVNDNIVNNNIVNNNIIHFVKTDINPQQIQILLEQKKYRQALQKIQGDKAKDYFNRWVIFLTQAIDQSISTQVDILQKSKYTAEKAVYNFETAQKLQIYNTLDLNIQTNINRAKQIYNFNKFKFCFAWNETLLDKLTLFTKDNKLILNLLQTEKTYIEKNKLLLNNFSNSCTYRLTKINKESQTQVSQLEDALNTYQNQYTQQYFKTLKDPTICSDNNLEQTLWSLNSIQKTIQKYKTNHMQILKALQENDQNYLSKLCKEIKNDSQIQSNISNDLQNLLKNLEKGKTIREDKKKEQTGEQKEKDSKWSHTHINKIDKYIKKEIQEKNIKRIQKIQKIKKQEYNPLEQLQSLFKKFYGDTDNYQEYEDKKQEFNTF